MASVMLAQMVTQNPGPVLGGILLGTVILVLVIGLWQWRQRMAQRRNNRAK